MSTYSKEYLEAVIGVLIERGLLEVEMVSDYENLPTLKLTEQGKAYLQKPVDGLDLSFLEKLADKHVIELDTTEQILFESLCQIRLRIAVAKGLPAYTICHDTILREMAKAKPNTPDALMAIHGIGKKFVKNYGEFFLEEIKKGVL